MIFGCSFYLICDAKWLIGMLAQCSISKDDPRLEDYNVDERVYGFELMVKSRVSLFTLVFGWIYAVPLVYLKLGSLGLGFPRQSS